MRRIYCIVGIFLLLTGCAQARVLPEDELPPPQKPWHVLMVCTVAPGQVHGMYQLFTKRWGCPAKNITVLVEPEGEAVILKDAVSGPPEEKRILEELDRLGAELTGSDRLLIVFACHMRPGFLIKASLRYEELDGRLTKFPDGTTIVVILEGCHSGGAIPVVKHANVLYTAGTKDQITYGGFLMFLVDALGRKEADMLSADADKDGRVSLREAYDFASDEERLTRFYSSLPKEIWPGKTAPTPMRKTRKPDIDKKMWLSSQ